MIYARRVQIVPSALHLTLILKEKEERKKEKKISKLLFFHFPIESHKVLGEFELAYLITKKKKKLK